MADLLSRDRGYSTPPPVFNSGVQWNGRPPHDPGCSGWHRLVIRAERRITIAEWDAPAARWMLPSLVLFHDRFVAAGDMGQEGWEYLGPIDGHPHLGRMLTCGSC